MSRNGDVGAHKGTLGVVCGSHVVGSTSVALTPAVVFGKRYPIVLGHQQRPYFLQAITLCVKNANLVRMRALCALPALSAALISMTVHLLAVIPTTSSRKPKLNALGCPKCSFCV